MLLILLLAMQTSLPDAPTIADAFATAFDGYTTVAMVGPHKACNVEVWMPQLYGRHPQGRRVASMLTLEFSSITAAAMILKSNPDHRKLHRLRWMPQALHSASHFAGVVNNFKVCR